MCFHRRIDPPVDHWLVVPAVLGYVLAQQFNQNNVSPEASPLTSHLEYLVGRQLCTTLGYYTGPPKKDENGKAVPQGWGHITADGSIANLESIWSVFFFSVSLFQ